MISLKSELESDSGFCTDGRFVWDGQTFNFIEAHQFNAKGYVVTYVLCRDNRDDVKGLVVLQEGYKFTNSYVVPQGSRGVREQFFYEVDLMRGKKGEGVSEVKARSSYGYSNHIPFSTLGHFSC